MSRTRPGCRSFTSQEEALLESDWEGAPHRPPPPLFFPGPPAAPSSRDMGRGAGSALLWPLRRTCVQGSFQRTERAGGSILWSKGTPAPKHGGAAQHGHHGEEGLGSGDCCLESL